MISRSQMEEALTTLAAAAAEAALRDEAFRRQLCDLLAKGPLPSSVIDRIRAVIEEMTAAALRHVLFDEGAQRDAALRCILLDESEVGYSIADLVQLWQVTLEDVADIFHDELLMRECVCDETRLSREESIRATLRAFRPVEIEDALGADFHRVRSQKWRTIPLYVHLPLFVAEAFRNEHLVGNGDALAAAVESFVLERFLADFPDAIPDGHAH